MRKFYVNFFTVFCILLFSTVTHAQLTGTKTIPGDYATIASAVTDLNAQGVGAGGVIFNVTAGHTENTVSEIIITATGTSANNIVFQKSGAGTNPKITRTDAGSTIPTALGAQGDGIIKLNGSDYIIFDGIDLAASDQGIEYGYITFKPGPTDGCQYVTIKNAVVTMTKGTSAYVIGIYISNGPTSLTSATGVTVSDAAGINRNITITGNTVSNVHAGVYCRGSSASAFYDTILVVGQSGAGNIIQNFGGGSATASYGVYMIYQKDVNVSHNTINNTAGGGANFTSTGYGIFHSTAANGDGAYNSNTINLSSTTGQLRAITFGTTGSAEHTINNNIITLSQAGTSETSCIYAAASVGSISITNNTFSIGTFASTTASYLIYASSSTPDISVTGNQTSGTITKTGNGTFYCYYNLGSPGSGTETIANNNFSNITVAGGSSTTGGIYTNTAVGQSRVCFSNTINNWTIGSSGTTAPLYCLSGNNNEIYNNTVSNITVTAAGTVYGLYFTGSNPTVSNNLIHTLTSGGTTFYGIWAAGTASVNCYRNKVYGLTNTNSSSTASNLLTGIYTSAGTTNNIYNNLVGNLFAPSSISPDAIRGIYVNYTTANANVNIHYNTLYINASSTGVNFGTTGIFHTTSATATSGSLSLRNNIILNKSLAAGTGFTVAYRRSNATTANYNGASNNNIFYAGTPSASNLIYADGTNSFSALNDYKSFILSTGADQNSETEDVPLQSTTGSSNDFLKYNTAVVNKAESGAENIAGITDDYAGTIRQGNPGYTGTGLKPDIGAWELEGILPSCTGTPAASNTIASPNPACTGQPLVLSLSQTYLGVTYQWQTSPDNTTYTDITSATSATLSLDAAAVSTWYRAIISCGVNNTISTPVQVIINPALNGSYTINNLNPTGGTNYNKFEDAINDLNCRGVSGPVTFNVTAGQVFVETGALNITATGTSVNTITFIKSGAGANPKIQRTGSAASTDYILRLTGSDFIAFNGIDLEQTGTSATDWVEYGLHITNASATDGAKNNTFKNGVISITNASTGSKGVYIQSPITPTATTGTNSQNRFLNMTVQNSFEGYRINGASSTYTDDGNEINTEDAGTSRIQNLGNATVAASMYGVYGTYQSNFIIRNTEISNLSNGGTSLVYGIALQTSASNSADFSFNNIHDITGGSTVNGINVTSADTLSIYNNRIHTLKTTSATSGLIRGMDIGGTGLNANIFNNQIYNISSDGLTTTTAVGLEIGTGLEYNIYNNMVSDIRAPGSTTTTGGTRGISVASGSTGGVVRIYYNSVYLTDAGSAAAYTSAALHNSSTTPTLDIRNNIIINKSTGNTRIVAFWKTSATDNVDNSSNNNLYYAGIPGATNLIYYDGTNSAQTISAYNTLTAITPGESASVTENVSWLPIVNGVLRPDPAIPTLVESGAQTISFITTDFEGTARNASTPDIGADEFVGPSVDITPPNILFTNLSDTCAPGNRNLQATISDLGGIPVSGTLQPRIYYRKNAGTWFSSQGVLAGGDGNNGTWNFTIIAADMGGLVTNDIVQYFVIAQDLANNVASRPSAGLVAANVNTVTTAPTTPESFTVLPTLNGTYTVGAGGNYTTLTAAINAYNNNCVTGAVVFELTDALYSAGETFPITINQNVVASATNTLTIRPAAGVAAVVTGSSAAGALIDMNGADYVTINGVNAGGSSLIIRNTSTTIPVIRFINDATHNTITNTIIEGSVTSTTNGQIVFSTSVSGTSGNSNNTISNSVIRDRTDATAAFGVAIYASGTAAAANQDNIITGNHFLNFTSSGVNIASTGNGNGWNISDNHFYNNLTPSTTQSGITIASPGTGIVISNNFIGGNAPNAGGVWTNSGNVAVNAINITNGVVTISNNTIANITTTNTGTTARTRGINFTSSLGNSVIQGNTIHSLLSSGAVTGYTAGSQAAVGLHYFPSGFQSLTVKQNVIYNISIENTNALTTSNIAAGMVLTNMGGMASENRIYDIKNKSTGTTAGQPPIATGMYVRFLTGSVVNNMISVGAGENNNVQYNGILVAGGTVSNTAAIEFYYNSVQVSGTATGANSSYAFLRGDNTSTSALQTVTLRNNILSNTRSGGTSANYAIGNQGTEASLLWNSNYNDLFSSNANNIGYFNSTGGNLANWQASSAGDANSISVLPVFISNSDLHLVSGVNPLINNAGTAVAGVTTDFDNEIRNATTPDIGADEFTPSVSTDFSAFELTEPIVKNCYTNNESVKVTIRNNSGAVHDFSLLPVTVNVSVTGSNPVTFTPVIVNTGSLAAGATLEVQISTNYDMSAAGTYTFNASTQVAGDVNSGNDAMTPVNRTVTALVAGTVSTSNSSYCVTPGTPTLTLAGSSAGATIQWQQSTTSATGPWTNVGTSTSTFIPATPISATTWYQALVSCGTNSVTSNTVTVTFSNPQVLTTTAASTCGSGSVTLQATASAGATLNWYGAATGGSSLGTGTSFTTPVLNTTTTYYVSAGEGAGTSAIGPLNTSIGTTSSSTIVIGTQRTFFDVLAPSITLTAVDIFPTAAVGSTFTIVIQNSAGVQIATSGNLTTTVTGGNLQTVPLNLTVPQGTGYRIGLGVNPGLNRNTSGAVYPYTIPGVLSITGNSFDPDYWYFLYNWQIGGGCVSPRTAVVATVDPPTAGGTASADQAICVGVTPADIVLSGHTGTVLKWQRSSDASFTSPVDIAVTSATLTGAQIGPLAATTYFRAVVQSGNCAPENSSVVTITVANPTATIAYTNSPYCFSAGTAAVSFTGTTGGSYAASPTGLSINASTGAITLGTSTAGTYTVTYSLAASGGCPAFSTSTSVTISSAGTWLGVTSADWNTASNWCGGIPTSTTDVTIPSVAPNMPNLSAGTGTVRNLSISNGGSVTVGTGGLLDLYGNISGTGTFTATNGSISFRGSANQATPGISAANITMNGSGGWTPGANSTVSGQLSLTSGHITLGNTNLSLQNSSTGSIASHIIVNGTGRVVVSNLAAANIRVVPVGSDASSYNPVTLLANAGHTTDNFTVGVQQGVFVNGSSGSTFTTHVVDRMWSINESTAGGSNVNITLQWTAGQELTNFNRAKSYLMQHNGSSWITAPETAASGNDPYTQTKQSVTSFGSFAVQTQPIPRPLTGIYPNPTRSQLNVVIDLPAAQKVTLTVFDAAGKLVKQYATNLNTGLNLYPMQVYDLSAGVYFIKVSISSNPEFMLTKFVKE